MWVDVRQHMARRGTFANCTHIIVSLLKAYIGDCDRDRVRLCPFWRHFKKVHTRNRNDLKRVIAYSTCSQLGYMVMICGLSSYSFQNKISARKVANWIIVDILKYLLLTLCHHWQALSNSVLLEMAIAKDYYLSLAKLYMYFLSIWQ